MTTLPQPPKKYRDFIERYPELAQAWERIHEVGRAGPLEERTIRLIKLGLAIGAQMQGSVHSSVRKGLALGLSREEMEQVVALSAGTVGLPSSVAAFTWTQDVLEKAGG